MIAYMCVTCQTALNDLHASQTLLLNCQTLILKFSVCVFEGGGGLGGIIICPLTPSPL